MSDQNVKKENLDAPELPPENLPDLPDDIIVDGGAPKKSNTLKYTMIGVGGVAVLVGVYAMLAPAPQAKKSPSLSGPVSVDPTNSLGTSNVDATNNPLIADLEIQKNKETIQQAEASAAKGDAVVAISPEKGFKTSDEDLLNATAPKNSKPVQNEELNTGTTNVNFNEPARPVATEIQKADPLFSESFAKIREKFNEQIEPGLAIPADIEARLAARAEAAQNGYSTVSNGSTNTGSAGTPNSGTINADIAAGELLYGELTTTLDTRVKATPVRVVIRGGKYNGAIAMGKMSNVDDEFMVLEFNMMTIGKKTYPINAIAINPNDWDVKISDKTYSGNWKRAALLAGKGYIQSYGDSYLSDNMTTTVSDGAIVQSRNGSLTSKARNAQALSGAMKTLDPFVQDYITKETKSYSQTFPGKEMGLLFMAPVVFR